MLVESPSKFGTYLGRFKWREGVLYYHCILIRTTHDVEYYFIIRFIMFLSDTMVITI